MNEILRFLNLPLNDSEDDLETHLKNNGYGLVSAVTSGAWILDSITYLVKNRAVCGMIANSENEFVAYKLGKICEKLISGGEIRKFESRAAVDDALSLTNARVIWRMWIPVQRALAGCSVLPHSIHITHSAMESFERVECEMTSCFRPSLNSYADQKECIKAQFRRFNKAVLMSNSDGVTLCRPNKKGWRAERLLTIECLNKYRSAERIYDVLYNKIRVEGERNPDNKVELLSVAAHALHAAARATGLNINGDDFSIFSAEEQAFLKEYDRKLKSNMKKISEEVVSDDDGAKIIPKTVKRNSMSESIKDKRKRLQKEREEREERQKKQAEMFSGLFSVT